MPLVLFLEKSSRSTTSESSADCMLKTIDSIMISLVFTREDDDETGVAEDIDSVPLILTFAIVVVEVEVPEILSEQAQKKSIHNIRQRFIYPQT
jgi:hypothetical protein